MLCSRILEQWDYKFIIDTYNIHFKGTATPHNRLCACNNEYRSAAVSYFAITLSIRTSKRNTLIANKIESKW